MRFRFVLHIKYFSAVLCNRVKSLTFDPNCHHESSCMWSYRPSAFFCAHSNQQQVLCHYYCCLCQLNLSSHSRDAHKHNSPFWLPKPVPSHVDFRVLIWTCSSVIFAEGSLTLITNVSRNPLQSPVTPPNTSPFLSLNASLAVIPLSVISPFGGVAKDANLGLHLLPSVVCLYNSAT